MLDSVCSLGHRLPGVIEYYLHVSFIITNSETQTVFELKIKFKQAKNYYTNVWV